MFLSILKKNFSFVFITLVIFFYSLFENTSLAKISDKYEVQTFYEEAPIMPGAAKYFIRTERIEKKTKVSNNHPIKIKPDILRKMLRQLVYKYDRNEPEIPLFSNKELNLLAEHVPKALMSAKSDEDITFVIKGPHSSARWSFKEDRLTAGRLFITNNQLNVILGTIQANLQPTLAERYAGNVWETAKLRYDVGHRNKVSKYEGLIVVFNKKSKGIYRKTNDRKDWFVFTNTAYKDAKENLEIKKLPKEQFRTLQGQIDELQRKLDNQPKRNQTRPIQRKSPPPQQVRKKAPAPEQSINEKSNSNYDESYVLEQKLKTIDSLYKKGILSEEEYNKKRKEILSKI
tara:strand:+ start:1583 stop:2614 length:1032 start_codon:yes stop_codon:yes gene_type:complete